MNTSGQAGTTLVLLSQQTSATDLFRENVNLLVQDISTYGLDLDSYTTLSEQQIKTLMENSKIILSERMEGKSGPYHKIIYTGSQNGGVLKFEQYYFVAGTTAFVLTLTTQEDQFENYKGVGERILNSFQLK